MQASFRTASALVSVDGRIRTIMTRLCAMRWPVAVATAVAAYKPRGEAQELRPWLWWSCWVFAAVGLARRHRTGRLGREHRVVALSRNYTKIQAGNLVGGSTSPATLYLVMFSTSGASG